jgi:hypothetical protein
MFFFHKIAQRAKQDNKDRLNLPSNDLVIAFLGQKVCRRYEACSRKQQNCPADCAEDERGIVAPAFEEPGFVIEKVSL